MSQPTTVTDVNGRKIKTGDAITIAYYDGLVNQTYDATAQILDQGMVQFSDQNGPIVTMHASRMHVLYN